MAFTEQQRVIYATMKKSNGPISWQNIANMAGIKGNSVRQQLSRMKESGKVRKNASGEWEIAKLSNADAHNLILEEIIDKFEDFFKTFTDIKVENNILTIDITSGDLTNAMGEDKYEEMRHLIFRHPEKFIGQCQKEYMERRNTAQKPFFSFSWSDEIVEIRSLRGSNLNTLVECHGDVNSVNHPQTRYKNVAWRCSKCGHVEYKTLGVLEKLYPPNYCNGGCGKVSSKSFILEENHSTVFDEQWFSITETNYREADKPSIMVRCRDELVESSSIDRKIVLGNTLKVVGIYKMVVVQNSRGKLDEICYLDASSVQVLASSIDNIDISEEDIQAIQEYAKEPNAIERLSRLVAPHIVGMELLKHSTLIASCYPHGVKDMRSNVNIMVLGDTGTGKTSVLEWWHRNYPKSNMAVGSGSSSVGLYGTVQRDTDRFGQKYNAVAGAIPRSDGGICVLDEIEKHLRTHDEGSLLEVLASRSATIHKGDVHVTLPADCAVFLAANWRHSVSRMGFDSIMDSIPIEITRTILDRVILLNADVMVTDEQKEKISEALWLKHEQKRESITDIPFIIKYISYARQKRPSIPEKTFLFMKSVVEAWKQRCDNKESARKIESRFFEDFICLSKSAAMLCLSDEVRPEHVKHVIPIFEHMLTEFASGMEGWEIDNILGEGMNKQNQEIMKSVLNCLEKSGGYSIEELLLYVENLPLNIKVIDIMERNGDIKKNGAGIYRKVKKDDR